ncbi:MAG TPA: NADPH:quinone reductase [Jatrophihabitans sp.]|nr:NADPH:quinone reductase [Jatrophihabitans sp.]
MRAALYTETGDPDVLKVIDKPVTEPGPGEVRIVVHRSGINPTDWKSRRGSGPGEPVSPAQVPHHDGSGVVDAVGEGVDAGWLGQRVWTWEAAYRRPEGTAQQQALVPVRQVVSLPDNAGWDLGASLGVPFLTAHRCLTVTEDGPDELTAGSLAGRVVLVAGGAGAVGNAAIQLARWAEATVITTVSGPAKAQLAAAAGADHVINYREQDVAAEIGKIAPAGVHSIVEVAPAANATIDAKVLAPNGSVACYANDGGDTVELPVRASMVPNARWQFVLLYTVPHDAKVRAVRAVSAALLAGAIRVGDEAGLPLHRYGLDDIARAHQAVEDSITGKVLLDLEA